MRKNTRILVIVIMALFAVHCSKKGDVRSVNPPVENNDDATNPPLIDEDPVDTFSQDGDVVGKVTVGYQGWFLAAKDGSPFSDGSDTKGWKWADGIPGPDKSVGFEMWPDVREYEHLYKTNFADLGNGQPAELYSDWDEQTVDKQFEWMQEYGIDCAALQRFGSAFGVDPRDKAYRDGIAKRVQASAEKHNVKFYIMYDISGWTNFQSEIKEDWEKYMKDYTSSPAYAVQNDKPVVCIWGIGVSGRPGDAASWSDIIDWFKEQGLYVVIGVKKDWADDAANSSAYYKADMISPWTVGGFKGISGADSYLSTMKRDLIVCKSNGMDYQPVVFPGFAWSNWNSNIKNEIPRLHGDFMWEQFANIRTADLSTAYVAMFDEYNEGTAIAKAAEDASMIPTDQYFLTLDADGVAVSSDFYLRLTNDGAKMLRKETPLVWEHPTAHKN